MRNKTASFLVSLVCAISLWIYVVTVVNPEDTVTISNIPVTFYGQEEIRQDRDLLVAEGGTDLVSVDITCKRSDRKKINADTVSAVVDISRLRNAGTYDLSYDVNFAEELGGLDISVTDRSPYRISFTLVKLASKQVQVKGVFKGNVAEGYMAEAMTFDREMITVEGPEDLVEQVSYAQVILERSDLDKTVTAELDYTLINSDGEKISSTDLVCDAETIEVTLPVAMFKEVPLSVEFIEGGGATGDNVIYDIDPETITLSGDAAILNGISKISLGNIDLGEFGTNEEFTFPILIPNEAKNVSGDETATVKVRIRGMETKTIRVTNIGFINKPDGYEADSMTQQLQALVRAKSSDIGRIATNNIRAVADLSDITSPGTYTVPVTLYIDGYTNAGTVGDYSVVVLVSEPEPVEE